ncbi:MAG: MFS transporter [Fodinibius sp.]|nr:MFS transporter [Fodinibius sp.]
MDFLPPTFSPFIMLYGGYLTFFPILLDEQFGQSSFIIGIMLSGSSVVTAIASSQLGNLTKRFKESSLIITAAILYLGVFISLPFIENIWLFALPIIVFGFAQGINIPSILNLLTHQAPAEYRAAFLSVNWTVLRSGQAAGPFLLGLVYGVAGLAWHFLGIGASSSLFYWCSHTDDQRLNQIFRLQIEKASEVSVPRPRALGFSI